MAIHAVANPAIHALLGGADPSSPNLPTLPGQGQSFGDMLMGALKEVNNSQTQASTMQDDFISGRKPVELHDLMISMEKAGTAMQLTTAIRNKVLDGYNEIEKLQV